MKKKKKKRNIYSLKLDMNQIKADWTVEIVSIPSPVIHLNAHLYNRVKDTGLVSCGHWRELFVLLTVLLNGIDTDHKVYVNNRNGSKE